MACKWLCLIYLLFIYLIKVRCITKIFWTLCLRNGSFWSFWNWLTRIILAAESHFNWSSKGCPTVETSESCKKDRPVLGVWGSSSHSPNGDFRAHLSLAGLHFLRHRLLRKTHARCPSNRVAGWVGKQNRHALHGQRFAERSRHRDEVNKIINETENIWYCQEKMKLKLKQHQKWFSHFQLHYVALFHLHHSDQRRFRKRSCGYKLWESVHNNCHVGRMWVHSESF